MKTKLEMAHEYAIALINSDCEMQFDKFIQLCWNYADAMQAEADKRECKERTDVLLTKDKDGNCLHFHHEFGHKKCMDCGASLEEWQPDWSQAPDVATHWTMRQDGKCLWWKGKPLFDGSCFYDAVGICHTVGYAPSFGYQGDWRNSLRKRPQ